MKNLCRLKAIGIISAVLVSSGGAPVVAIGRRTPAIAPLPVDDRAIAHVLNRLGYSARPGDVDRVRAIGLAGYIEQQLRPERIPDAALTRRLRAFTTLDMSTRELAERYYLPALLERRERKRDAAQQRSSGRESHADPETRFEQYLPDRLDGTAPGGQMTRRAQPDTERDRRPPGDVRRDGTVVLAELTEQRLLRAVYSARQLEEVMVDFWFNHFNVFAGKSVTRLFLTEYERDTIRPHVLGHFRELLGAVAESPAMLFYLDNWMSTDPDSTFEAPLDARRTRMMGAWPGFFNPRRPARNAGGPDNAVPLAPRAGQRRGLNENYARELMELHTLGVDGGYTQKDVVEVARAFTGWTIVQPRQGGGFYFEPRMHDPGQKLVLGRTFKSGGGKNDGERVLDLLAAHPSTARFIATKLARRFVSDDPPVALIDRAAARFRATGGDIREVVRTIVTSPEFFAPEAYRAKVKTPLDFVVSAARVTNARVDNALPLGLALRELGMPLYFAQPPTGYADRADAWVNAGGLLNRMNFGVALLAGQLWGLSVDLGAVAEASDMPTARDRLLATILMNDVSPGTREAAAKAAELRQVAALALGSPEFQRR